MKKLLGVVGSVVKGAAGLLGGDIATKAMDVMKAITDKAATDPELQRLLDSHEQEMTQMVLADRANAREVIKTALQSDDAFVRRARPTFLYIMYFILLLVFVPPVIRLVIFGEPVVFPALPEPLYYLFGSGYLGYATLRESGKGGWFSGLKNKFNRKAE